MTLIGPEHPRYLELFESAFGSGQSIPGRLMPRPDLPDADPASEEDPSTQESEVGVRSAAEDGGNE